MGIKEGKFDFKNMSLDLSQFTAFLYLHGVTTGLVDLGRDISPRVVNRQFIFGVTPEDEVEIDKIPFSTILVNGEEINVIERRVLERLLMDKEQEFVLDIRDITFQREVLNHNFKSEIRPLNFLNRR